MSKKASKKTKTKQPAVPVEDPEPWIEELKTLAINDDHWRCNVSFLMDTSSLNSCYVVAFNEIFMKGKNVRPCINVISNTSLACSMLEKSYKFRDQKDINLSPYAKLCDEAIKYCAPDGFTTDIPVPILASLIKYHLYDVKVKTCTETELLKEYEKKKKNIEEESLIQLQNIVKRTPTSKKDKAKSTPKKSPKSGGKAAPVKFTTLRKRGEKFLDGLYVHDEGPDGPDLYVILTGFKVPDLPLALLKLQIPLIAIVKLHDLVNEDTDTPFCKKDNRRLCLALDKVSKLTKIKQRRYSNPMEETYLYDLSLKQFWSQFLQILTNKDNISWFKDTMFFKFYPYTNLINKLNDCYSKSVNEQAIGTELQGSIYRQFCFLQYDLQDLKRQHENYVHNLIIQDVNEKNSFSFNEMEFYSSTMDSVPSEIINIPFILNAILLQVEHSLVSLLTPKKGSTDTSISDNDKSFIEENTFGKESKLSSRLKELDKTYDLFNCEEILTEKTACAPVILVEGDEIGLKSYWWDKTNFVKDITCNILVCFWDMFFRRHLPLYDDIFSSFVKDNNGDLFELLKATGDLTLFYKLTNLPCCFNKILVEDKAYVFCCDSFSEVLDDKSSVNISLDYEDDENTGTKAKKILYHYSDPLKGQYMGQIFDDHSYCFEEMTSDVLLQNLFKSFESFNCLDLQQDYFRDKLYLKFHNRTTCLNKEYLMGTLKTPTALKDFYDYIVEEEFYLLNEKELSYIESLQKKERDELNYKLKQLEHLKKKTLYRAAQICDEKNFLIGGSVKSEIQPDLERFSLASEASRRDSEYKNTTGINEFLKAFDIDLPNRVQFSERRQEIVLSYNSKLLIKKLWRLYADEAIFFQTTIHGHTLYFFRPINKIVSKHFHLLHESGMIFYLKKYPSQSGRASDQFKDYGIHDMTKVNEFGGYKGEMISDVESIKKGENIFEPVKYRLSLSLPNSLCLEVVNPQDISLYIKQNFLSKIPLPSEISKEKFRCYLLDGKLVKFMNDESIIIYHPNSEIYNCKKIVYESSSVDDILSEVKSFEKEQTPGGGKKKERKLSVGKIGKIKNDVKDNEFSQTKFDTKKAFTTTVDSYECTLSTGRRISVDGEKHIELEPLFFNSHTDLLKGINVIERHDGSKLTHNFEGTLTVDFPDGSRITTFAEFAKDEIFIELSENGSETDENSEDPIETNESNPDDSGSLNHSNYLKQSNLQSQGFVLIEVSYLTEHSNFATVSINTDAKTFNLRLPYNVHISLSPQGLYTMNLNEKAQLIVDEDELTFREINPKNLPACTLHLCDTNNEKTENDTRTEDSEKLFHSIFSCTDYNGNILEVDILGNVHPDGSDYIKTICKCDTVSNNRLFIVNNQFSGLEVFSPNTLDACIEEAENCVSHYYASADHHALLLIKPVLENEFEKWHKVFNKIKYFPQFPTPSTYKDRNAHYNPFPKIKKTSPKIKSFTSPKAEIPEAFLVRLINRVNCNIHLQKNSFLQNKHEADLLRVNKYPYLAVELYERGNVPFCIADKSFIQNTKFHIIGNLISRARKHVVARLERMKRKEYELILRERKLLPYFDSAHGAVHLIILEMLGWAVEGSYNKKEGSMLEKLLKVPLNQLTDADLDFMHDKIAQFTVSSICSCITNRLACRLRILLLAGRVLHGLIPDMISVFFLYAENMKRKKYAEEERRKEESNLLKELLMRPLHLLTENDFQIVHDKLKNLPYCSCSTSPEKCKLKILLLASAVLNDFFPNLDSVFKSSVFDAII